MAIVQPSPGTTIRTIKGLAKNGVPRPVTGKSNQNKDKSKVLRPGHPANPTAPIDPDIIGAGHGGRVQPKAKVAAKAKVKSTKTGSTVTGGANSTSPAASTPGAPALTVEDQALQGNYDPNQVTGPNYGAVGSGGKDLASQFNPASYAKAMAGQQYDPAITQMATRIKGIINALPGSLDSLHKAFANLDARAAAPPTVNVVGGPTTAAADAYQGTLAANANTQAQSQARSDDARQADWEQRIRLLSGANVNDLRGQLQGLTQQRADAQVGYYNQGIKTKSDLVSQAISNINSMRASNAAMALTGANLEGAGLKNAAQALANQSAAQQNLYAPYMEDMNLQQGVQGLQTGAQNLTMGQISIEQARKNLQSTSGKNLSSAISTGGPTAIQNLTSLIIPQGGITQDGAYQHIHGDPNAWVKSGVAQIMRTLPKSNRANVTKFVQQQVAAALGPAGGWKQNKNGKWVRPK